MDSVVIRSLKVLGTSRNSLIFAQLTVRKLKLQELEKLKKQKMKLCNQRLVPLD